MPVNNVHYDADDDDEGAWRKGNCSTSGEEHRRDRRSTRRLKQTRVKKPE